MEQNYTELARQAETLLPTALEYSGKVTLALLNLMIGWWLINPVASRANKLLARRSVDRTLQGFLGSLINIALKLMLIISVGSMIGVQTTSFVAAIGAAGLAIGLALQKSLSNFAGGRSDPAVSPLQSRRLD